MNKLKYKLRQLKYWKALFSPFKPFNVRFYAGKIAIGVPYFYPRKWVKSEPGYTKPVPLTIGFSSCGLGWKTKWTDTDYRYEWGPVFSFVFFGYQIAAMIGHRYCSEYWQAWLYYEYSTDKTKSKKERIEQCIKEHPQTYSVYHTDGRKETIDYYKLILKKKYYEKNDRSS